MDNKMISCDCAERIGKYIDFDQYEKFEKFFEKQVQKGIFEKIKDKKHYICKSCGTLWILYSPEERSHGGVIKYSDGVYRKYERPREGDLPHTHVGIRDVFEAVDIGTFEEFLSFYSGDINEVNEETGENLLLAALYGEFDQRKEKKVKIIQFLIAEGIDVNFVESEYQRNALNFFYFKSRDAKPPTLFEVTKILVEAGVEINTQDKFGMTPLHRILANNYYYPNDELQKIFKFLLEHGAKYDVPDYLEEKTPVDYARDYFPKQDFLDIFREL